MHPHLAESHVDAWRKRESRHDARNGMLQFIIAASQGVKINGRRCKPSDFIPSYAKETDSNEMKEAKLKKAIMAIAQKKGTVKHG